MKCNLKFTSMETKWKVFFGVILFLWIISICTIFYYFITGQELLVDYEVNIYFITLPALIIVLLYTFLAILITSIHVLKYEKIKKWQNDNYLQSDKLKQGNKLCSIIIAARNEDSVIRKTVTACLKQTHKNIEVIVICHNCNDRTVEEA